MKTTRVKKCATRGSSEPTSEDKALDLFAELVIEKMESLQSEWKKPWFTEAALSWPRNMNGRYYNGMNAFMLTLAAEKFKYQIPVWCTFERVKSLNQNDAKDDEPKQVSVTKGAKSFPVFLTVFKVVKESGEHISYDDYKQLSDEERNKYKVYPKLKVFRVFNVSQTNIEEARPELYKKLVKQFEKKQTDSKNIFAFPAMDETISKQTWICPIEPTYGDEAYYSISKNKIVIPQKEQFKDGESFYSNLWHEMSHSTGSKEYLARLADETHFGYAEYAREELIAEMSAALVGLNFGIDKHLKEDSCSYLKSWLNSLHEDRAFLKTVLLEAKRSAKMIIDHLQQEETPQNAK